MLSTGAPPCRQWKHRVTACSASCWQNSSSAETTAPEDFNRIGVVSRVHKGEQVDDHLQVLVECLQRIRIDKGSGRKPPFTAGFAIWTTSTVAKGRSRPTHGGDQHHQGAAAAESPLARS